MIRVRPIQLFVFALAACLAGSASERLGAQTQMQMQSPAQLKMQSPSRRDGKTDVLTVGVSGGAGVEDNGQPAPGEIRDPQFIGRQAYSELDTFLTYNAVNSSLFGVQLNAMTGLRYYGSVEEILSTGESIGGSLAFPLSRGTRVAVTSGFTYAPNYALASYTGLVPNTDSAVSTYDLSLLRRPAYTSGLSAAVTQSFGVRSSLSLNYGLRRSDFVNSVDPSLVSQSGSVMFRYLFNKNVGFHAGYGRRVGEYDLLTFTQSHPIEDIDLGLDYNYNRGVSLSRKTTLSFGSGSSITEQDQRRHFTVTGSVNLDQALGRYSHATLTYSRGVQLLEGFRDPVYSDTLTGSLNGALGQRVRVATSFVYSLGQVGLSGSNNDYDAWNGGGRITVDLSRMSMLYVAYAYSQSNIGNGVELLTAVPNAQHRHSLRVGASLHVPVIRKRVTERK